MKKLLPFLLLTLFVATSCEDEVEAVSCATVLTNLEAMPFSAQLQNFPATEEPDNWKINCEAYMVEYQAAYDDGCLDGVTADDVTTLDAFCDVYETP
tara:strand:- start:132 stop:422 length:291 start_codon:yes stop_codon:yes gene_type:complete